MLDTTYQSWKDFTVLAEKAIQMRQTYYSPVEERRYQVKEVTENKIVIERETGDDAEMGSKFFLNRMVKINSQGGTANRKDFQGSIAQMTTLAALHPGLKWLDKDTISEMETVLVVRTDTKLENPDAPNDNLEERQMVARRVRRGQVSFRNNLLNAYGNKCCVTGCSVSAVLQAAHIQPFSSAGVNATNNGLLLRSDIHDLFDDRMIKIEPVTHLMFIDESIRYSEYGKYDKKKIADRVDGSILSDEYLKLAWKD